MATTNNSTGDKKMDQATHKAMLAVMNSAIAKNGPPPRGKGITIRSNDDSIRTRFGTLPDGGYYVRREWALPETEGTGSIEVDDYLSVTGGLFTTCPSQGYEVTAPTIAELQSKLTADAH